MANTHIILYSTLIRFPVEIQYFKFDIIFVDSLTSFYIRVFSSYLLKVE